MEMEMEEEDGMDNRRKIPQKRKLSEYQDPDYLKNGQSFQKRKIDLSESVENEIYFDSADKSIAKSHENKRDRICAVIQNEFKKDLESKEKEILIISNRISIAKRLLRKIRYAVVANYYNKSSIITSESQEQNFENSVINLGQQSPFHPAVKDVLGMKSEDYNEMLKMRPTRQAAQNAKTTIKEKLQTKKDKKDEKLKYEQNTEDIETFIPKNSDISSKSRYLMKWEKPVAKINTSRGINQTRQLIVVGNTSKYIGNESSTDNATHKWLIYCQSRTKCPIEEFIKKVRFILHPSYKPNDVIDISSPPFQLTRRGWGEFPVQVQLFFHFELQQKPLQVVHNLILDKKMTGLQTMGAETLLEVWLRSSFFKRYETPIYSRNNENKSHLGLTFDPIIDCNNSDESQSSFNDNESELKSSKLLEILNKDFAQNIENIPKDFSLDIKNVNCDSKQKVQIFDSVDNKGEKMEAHISKYVSCKSVKPSIMKNVTHHKRNQQSLLKPQISLLKRSLIKTKNKYIVNRYPNIIDHDYTLPSLPNVKENQDIIQIKNDKIIIKPTRSYQQELEHIFHFRKFTNENQAVEFLLKSVPLVNSKAKDVNYGISFPFVVENLEAYHKLMAPKRKSNEWLQAKYFSVIMQKHQQFSSSYWTAREILLFSRSHGYSPNIFTSEINTPCYDFNELIKNEIKKQIVDPITVTSCNSIYTWLNDIKQKNICNLNKIEYDEILDIEKVDDTLNTEISKEITLLKHNKILLGIPKKLKSEQNLIKDSCFEIGIQLKPEEIITGVDCPAAEVVLSKALRCFIEDLIRRTVFKQNERSQKSSTIECHHIKNAILSYKKLDFLTNNYLGI